MADVVSQTAPIGASDRTITQTGKSQNHVQELTILLQGLEKDAKTSDAQAILEKIVDALEHADPAALDGVGKDTWDRLIEFLTQWIKHPETMIPTQWEADYTDLVSCRSVQEVQTLVKDCLATGKVLRTAGAQHSAPEAVFAPKGDKAVRMKLEGSLRFIDWLHEDPDTGTATLRVGAGCNLGVDPSDPNSNQTNALSLQLDERGYALPILGGNSHQTLGGYMSTSTAGGSIDFGCAESIVAIELVDGQGEVRKLDRDANPDDFNAAAVSMGLFGIFTHITIVVDKRYLVKGTEETVVRYESMLASGKAFLEAVRQNKYVHNVWFAAEFVNSVLQFIANPVSEDFHPVVPYEHPLEKPYMNYAAAAAFLLTEYLTYKNAPLVAAFIFNLVQPVGSKQEFCDHWFRALPNDDLALVDLVIRVQFTEIWLDLEDAPQALDALTELFNRDPHAAGNFGVEIYPGKKSPFWMSMSYGRDVVRIDPYWWEYNVIGNLQDYFEKFWKILLTFPSARLHWGKHWPAVGNTYGDRTIGPDFVYKSYPRFADWKALRAKYDPKNVFVTKYWNDLLGLH